MKVTPEEVRAHIEGKRIELKAMLPEEAVGSWIECEACKVGLPVTAGALIAAALAAFPEDAPICEEIADLLGLDSDVVEEIIKKCAEKGVGAVVDELCSAMGAC